MVGRAPCFLVLRIRKRTHPLLHSNGFSPLVITRTFVVIGLLAPTSRADTIPAFSGSDGAGASATGGRGGVVYHVTRLDGEIDGGRIVPGTLAYGLNDANFSVGGVVRPRTIVFDV